ncbi:MAG: hypothetical protein ACTSWN_13580 [Promethearchaeota archaeon]
MVYSLVIPRKTGLIDLDRDHVKKTMGMTCRVAGWRHLEINKEHGIPSYLIREKLQNNRSLIY